MYFVYWLVATVVMLFIFIGVAKLSSDFAEGASDFFSDAEGEPYAFLMAALFIGFWFATYPLTLFGLAIWGASIRVRKTFDKINDVHLKRKNEERDARQAAARAQSFSGAK